MGVNLTVRLARAAGWVLVIGGGLVAVLAFLASRAPEANAPSALAIAGVALAVSAGSFWLLRHTAPAVDRQHRSRGLPDDMYASAWTTAALSADPERQGRARPVDDPFEDLPFEMMLPVRWRPGLPQETSAEGIEQAYAAAFVAHDPESWSPTPANSGSSIENAGYSATLAVFASEPVQDTGAYLSNQERELRSGMETDRLLTSYELTRVALPAGESLRALFEHDVVQVQYYLPTPAALIELWFTAPVSDRYRYEDEVEVMAQSFRLKPELP